MEKNNIKIFKARFDVQNAKRLMSEGANMVINEFMNKSVDGILDIVYKRIDSILNRTIIYRENAHPICNNSMEECDNLFRLYLDMLRSNQGDPNDITKAYQKYQEKRCQLNINIIKKLNNHYKLTLDTHDERKLWQMVDWSGNMNRLNPKKHPSITEMSEIFTMLYEPIENDDDVNNLESNIYILITDEPITIEELVTSSNQLKKRGI